MPQYVLQLSPEQKYAVVVDSKLSRLYVFKNVGGLPHYVADYYVTLGKAGVDVLYDDTGERPGAKFASMELIGIPHRIVIGERGLKEGKVEYKGRHDAEAQQLALPDIAKFVQLKLCA